MSEKEDYFIVSLSNYLKANDGKIPPDREVVFNYYESGYTKSWRPFGSVARYTSVSGYTVNNVRISEDGEQCTGTTVKAMLVEPGEEKICDLRNAHVELPLSFLKEPPIDNH